MRAIKNIETKIKQLSPGLIEELDHYLDYLINKRVARKPEKLKQDWAGGLKDIKITSIELQKLALDWRQK
jgi:5'-deoxynucleotidase YfbR-like HD superfamily hydrolase